MSGIVHSMTFDPQPPNPIYYFFSLFIIPVRNSDRYGVLTQTLSINRLTSLSLLSDLTSSAALTRLVALSRGSSVM